MPTTDQYRTSATHQDSFLESASCLSLYKADRCQECSRSLCKAMRQGLFVEVTFKLLANLGPLQCWLRANRPLGRVLP